MRPPGLSREEQDGNGSHLMGRLSTLERGRAVLLCVNGSSARNASISARPERQMGEALPGIQEALGQDAGACGRSVATSPLMN